MSRGNLKYSTKERFFDTVDIITSRPEGMTRDEYKARMKAQNKVIKQYLKGEIVHTSKLYPTKEIVAHFGLKEGFTVQDILEVAQQEGKESVLLLLRGFTYARNKEA